MDDIVTDLNKTINSGQLDGRIITVQSLKCEAEYNWAFDPETTLSSLTLNNVYILRIFFEMGPQCDEEVGMLSSYSN